jgi:hypothetical protein
MAAHCRRRRYIPEPARAAGIWPRIHWIHSKENAMSTIKQTRRKSAAGSKAQPRTDTHATGNGETRMSENERRHMVAEAAYYRALSRGFAAGGEMEDWLAAEREINRLFGSTDSTSPVRKANPAPASAGARTAGDSARPTLTQ